MTKATFVASINKWLNKRYDDDLITQWIRMAEERISEELRIKDMIAIDVGVIVERCVQLPLDWKELDFVHFTNGKPIEFKSRTDFYNIGESNAKGFYTITGNFMFVGGPIDSVNGTSVEISYYESVPPLIDEDTWLLKLYPRLFTAATLASGSMFGLDEQRAVIWETETKNRIDTMNVEHLRSKNSGSRLASKRKGFG